jgi:hypothetical protein
MTSIRKPSKESVRAWLRQRRTTCEPSRSPEQIRAELGWLLVPPPHRNSPSHKETS